MKVSNIPRLDPLTPQRSQGLQYDKLTARPDEGISHDKSRTNATVFKGKTRSTPSHIVSAWPSGIVGSSPHVRGEATTGGGARKSASVSSSAPECGQGWSQGEGQGWLGLGVVVRRAEQVEARLGAGSRARRGRGGVGCERVLHPAALPRRRGAARHRARRGARRGARLLALCWRGARAPRRGARGRCGDDERGAALLILLAAGAEVEGEGEAEMEAEVEGEAEMEAQAEVEVEVEGEGEVP